MVGLGAGGQTSVAEGVGKQGRLEKSGRPDSGPAVTWVTVTFSLSGRENPWMVLSKGVNKDHCGYRGKKGTRTNRKIS